jgi:hypothetical protein
MATERRVRLGESDGMEGGVRCPRCGTFVSFGDVVARTACPRPDCEVRLALDLVVQSAD